MGGIQRRVRPQRMAWCKVRLPSPPPPQSPPHPPRQAANKHPTQLARALPFHQTGISGRVDLAWWRCCGAWVHSYVGAAPVEPQAGVCHLRYPAAAPPCDVPSPSNTSLRGSGGSVTYLQDGAVTVCGLTFYGTPFSPVSRSPNHAFQVNGCLCAVEVGAFSSDGVYALLCVIVGILVVAMFSLVHRSYSISFTRAQGIPKYTVNRASTNGVQTQLSAPFERHPRTGYNRNSLHVGSDHGWLVGAGGVTRRGLPCTYPHLHPLAHTTHPPTCCVADGGAPGCGGPAG